VTEEFAVDFQGQIVTDSCGQSRLGFAFFGMLYKDEEESPGTSIHMGNIFPKGRKKRKEV